MNHNFEKMAEEGKEIRSKHSCSNLTFGEFQELVQESIKGFQDTGDTYDAIARLLDIGVAMGYRMRESEET